ncbi:MAG TPA: SDR family NAD(P)-dependent oxidoreductase, partial [Paenirhodobacter sp.]
MKTLLSIGHGYSAQALAGVLLPQGWRIIATTRTAENAARLAATGVEPLIWPGGDLPFDQATHLLSSVAPDAQGDPVLRASGVASGRYEWVGYLSTVGVYGDRCGDWVDEATPPTPATDR